MELYIAPGMKFRFGPDLVLEVIEDATDTGGSFMCRRRPDLEKK